MPASSSSLLSLNFHIYEMRILIPILENIEDLMGLYYPHFVDKETKASESLSNLLKITQLNIKWGKLEPKPVRLQVAFHVYPSWEPQEVSG